MSFCKKPCKTCPFRTDVRPFLHPDRALGIAYATQNPYEDFPCHNTFEYTDEEDVFGDAVADLSESKTCAGFLTMRAQSGIDTPKGFEPSFSMCYTDIWEMYQVYGREWKRLRNRTKNDEK